MRRISNAVRSWLLLTQWTPDTVSDKLKVNSSIKTYLQDTLGVLQGEIKNKKLTNSNAYTQKQQRKALKKWMTEVNTKTV